MASRAPAGLLKARLPLASGLSLQLLAAALVTVPVFLQAPWVRIAPMQAALFTIPLAAAAILLEQHGNQRWRSIGALLMGFCGSWLGGTLFWGWCRLHPVWHLPLEGLALPLAVAGLASRWRLAGTFYLASFAGTALTDLAMLSTGIMPLWPEVLQAPIPEAPLLLQGAARQVLRPNSLVVVLTLAGALVGVCRMLWRRSETGRLAAVTLATTLVVDGLFLALALLAPCFSGLI